MYLPATQPCTVTSTTGYRVPTGYWLHSLVHLLQQLVTECTDRPPAKQPCTVTSITGYSMYRPASQPYTVASTGYRVYQLVLATQSCTLASTYRLQSLLTRCWLHNPYCTVLHPNWLHRKSWLNIDQ